MSIVNADAAELLQTWNNIKTAITSIETTNASISRRYRDLGNSWKDKKYDELGDVLQECNRAFNEVLKTLTKGEKYVGALAKSLAEYENTTLESGSDHVQASNESLGISSSFGGAGIFSAIFNAVNQNKNMYEMLNGVEHKPIIPAYRERNEQEIISSISGGDKTDGSCSSLALAYAGNRAGYIVFDFRGGKSRGTFSLRSTIEQIANLDGVDAKIMSGTDDVTCATELTLNLEPGREYYLATGEHAAIVRNNGGQCQYLELQSGDPDENGWHTLTLTQLYERFNCRSNRKVELTNYLIELGSLQRNAEFLNILGYINTDENAQQRGADGYAR